VELGRISHSANLSGRETQEQREVHRGAEGAIRAGVSTTIQGAFRDVSNALVAYRKDREFRIEQEQLLAAAKDAAQLSEIRFRAGKTDYLEVLTNETNAFSAELTLAQANGNELLALVQLYQSLGGGWQQ